ncbi:MAG: large subunit ribosomal protein L32e [Candidatus Woesearchaeota archaeon]|nr:large subunit ribosomal protein L32e [Candidatus Woesearchaeota archaeon]
MIDELIAQRSQIKRRKPDFKQEGFNSVKRIRNNDRWRRPTGSQSKMRLNKKGGPSKRKSGYSSPKEVRGMIKNGLMPVVIKNADEIKAVDAKKECAVIASSVGSKKRIKIIKAAIEQGISLYGIKDPVSYLKKLEDDFKARKTRIKQKPKKTEEKIEEAQKQTKKTIEENITEEEEAKQREEQKEQQKKEWDKILTQKS